METLKELKAMILEKIDEDALKVKYEEISAKNELFTKNKRMAYYMIARELKVKVQSNVASATKEAFPLSIEEARTNEKQNFNLSGFVIGDVRPFINNSGKQQAFVQLADNTGTLTFTVFEEQLPKFETVESGQFITLSNLYWKDKGGKYGPTFGQYSSVNVTESTFEVSEVIVDSIASLKDEGYYAIKGLVVDIPEGTKTNPFHCARGHWFKGLSESDLGKDSKCVKCEDIMEVEQHVHVNGLIFADTEKDVTVSIGTFAELDDINIFEEYILRGQYKDNVFNANKVIALKKN